MVCKASARDDVLFAAFSRPGVRMIAHSQANCLHQPIELQDNSDRSHAGKISDGTLIAAIARRDRQAMRWLYERHSFHLYRFARRMGTDHSAAEDLVSEVFLDVWQHRAGAALEGPAQVSTW